MTLIANECLLPSQWREPSPFRPPVMRLLSAVLDEAFRNLRGDTNEGRSACDWFKSGERVGPFSFLAIREALEIDPATYRKAAWRVWRKRLKVSNIVRRSVGRRAA